MAYQNYEIKGLVNQLRGDFQGLYELARHHYDIVYGRHGYAGTATGAPTIQSVLMDLDYAHILPVVSPEVGHAASQLINRKLASEPELHIQAKGDSYKGKADKLEVIEANLLLQLNAGGMVDHAINRHMAVSPFAPVWIEKNPYTLPKRKRDESDADYIDRVDDWKRDYIALRLRVGDPLACAFYEDGLLGVSLSIEEVVYNVVDFARDYGEYDRADDNPDLMWEVWEKQFGHVRAQYGMSNDRAEFTSGKEVSVCKVDNGEVICHYIKGHKDGDYEQASEDSMYPNPFGQVALEVVPGKWNPDAYKIEDRYQPLLLPLIVSRWNLDLARSEMMSRAAELPDWAVKTTPEVSSQMSEWTPEQWEKFKKASADAGLGNRLRYLLGEPVEMARVMSPHFAEALEEMGQEHARYRPSLGFDDPEMSLAKQAPTSTVIKVQEISDSDVREAQRNKNRAKIRILERHEYYWKCAGQEGHPAADEVYYATATGQEKVRGREVKYGTKVELQASEFDFPKTRELEPVDATVSSRLNNLEIVRQRMLMPDGKSYILEEDIYSAMGISNPTEYAGKKRAERRYQFLENPTVALNFAASMRDMALTEGLDMDELAQRMGAMPTAPQPPQGGGQPGGRQVQVLPPRTESTGMSTEA